MENREEVKKLIQHLENHALIQAPSEIWQDRQSNILRVRANFDNGENFSLDISDWEIILLVKKLFQQNLKRVFSRTSEFRDLLNLQIGQRYTVLVGSEFGLGVHAMQITLDSVKVGRYAQYDNCVELIFKQKNKRNLRSIQFYGRKDFAVFAGWIEVNTDPFGPAEHDGIMVCQKSKYASFDDRYMTDAIASAKVTPICSKRFLETRGGL